MKRGVKLVEGIRRDGSTGRIDVLDLDDASFRAYVLDALEQTGVFGAVRSRSFPGEPIQYRERTDAHSLEHALRGLRAAMDLYDREGVPDRVAWRAIGVIGCARHVLDADDHGAAAEDLT